MPRKADERGFGFRSEGILRVLTAADAEQVLIAVEELGFRLPDRAPITSLTELIAEVHGESENIIAGFFTDVFEILEKLWITQLGGRDISQNELNAFERSMRQIRARRLEVVLDLKEKRSLIETRADQLFFKIGAI